MKFDLQYVSLSHIDMHTRPTEKTRERRERKRVYRQCGYMIIREMGDKRWLKTDRDRYMLHVTDTGYKMCANHVKMEGAF